MGVKKSVVATIACSSFNRYTAASSLDSIPTSRSFGSPRTGVLARISESTAGAILQPQPPPWEYWVSRISSAGAFIGLPRGSSAGCLRLVVRTRQRMVGERKAPELLDVSERRENGAVKLSGEIDFSGGAIAELEPYHVV